MAVSSRATWSGSKVRMSTRRGRASSATAHPAPPAATATSTHPCLLTTATYPRAGRPASTRARCRALGQNDRVLLDEIASTSVAVAASSARLAKVERLAACLRRLEPGEVHAAAAGGRAVRAGDRGRAAVPGRAALGRAAPGRPGGGDGRGHRQGRRGARGRGPAGPDAARRPRPGGRGSPGPGRARPARVPPGGGPPPPAHAGLDRPQHRGGHGEGGGGRGRVEAGRVKLDTVVHWCPRSTHERRQPVEAVQAAIYCRISFDLEGLGLGVERQLRDCLELAEKLGWYGGEV